ncbi:protein MTL1-like [Vicia villosa]|uniref:protein MTL1-like n=1 Tax=Vicia villosa TaxID=3911 RepID=UPI00273C449C|nr:protein MTL1-like [Vicia villosa]
MAIELCSEISITPGISPRISFSHDLKSSTGSIPVEDPHIHSDLRLLDSTASDFVFTITNTLSQQLSSADELFSNGKIIPLEIKNIISNESIPPLKKSPSSDKFSEPILKTHQKRLKEFLSDETDTEDEKPTSTSTSSKHFWQFKRSSSLNIDTSRRSTLIRSLQFLSRSNSTGSAPNPKQTQKQNLQKQSSVSSSRRSSSSSSTSSTYYFYSSSSLKKCSSNGVRISPVLNLPQSYIPKATASFFGFGSLFCKGKSKRKKK